MAGPTTPSAISRTPPGCPPLRSAPTTGRSSPPGSTESRLAESPKVLLTGAPGSGKTTLVREVVRELDPSRVAGFTTEEIREGGERLGFRVRLLHEEAVGCLAH